MRSGHSVHAVTRGLAYRLLERAHVCGEWAALRLPPECTYAWFSEVQRRAGAVSASTQYVLLLCVVRIARQLAAAGDGDVEAATERAAEVAAGDGLASGQQRRRVYRTANLVWHRLRLSQPPPGGRLAAPLALPPAATDRVRHDVDADGYRVFTAAEVDALVAAASGMSRRAGLLMRLLFTTGLRIGAAANVTWGQVLEPGSREETTIRRTASVREKGDTVRHILLTEGMRLALAAAFGRRPFGGVCCVYVFFRDFGRLPGHRRGGPSESHRAMPRSVGADAPERLLPCVRAGGTARRPLPPARGTAGAPSRCSGLTCCGKCPGCVIHLYTCSGRTTTRWC